MIKISSITIAKNEELNLEKSLKSLEGVIDEKIVLVDNTSADNTFEVAKKYADIADLTEWKGYSATKQAALAKCGNDWILWIDADEELTPELQKEIIRWKKGAHDYAAYKIARRAYFLNKWIKHCGWYPGYVTRLFNKNLCSFSKNDVHEYLKVNGKIGKLKHDLNHYTDPNIWHYFEKFNRYTSLAAEELYAKEKKAKLSDLILRPAFLFIKMFILRKGFLDGIHGLILSVFSATYVFTKYAKLWEKQIED